VEWIVEEVIAKMKWLLKKDFILSIYFLPYIVQCNKCAYFCIVSIKIKINSNNNVNNIKLPLANVCM